MNESLTPRTDAARKWEWVPGQHAFTQLEAHYETMTTLARALESELSILKSKREAAIRYGADSLESDSIENSCNCLERTSEAHLHKPGCKYRLISERNAARQECERLRAALQWRNEPADQPGWWWAQNEGDIPGQVWIGICRVDYNLDGELFASWMTAPGEAATLKKSEWSEHTLWCGPVQEPEALTNK